MEIKQSVQYKQLGVRMSDEMFNKVAEKAKQEQRSMSQIAKMAIEQYLAKQ